MSRPTIVAVAAAATFAVAQIASARPLPPPVYATDTPTQLTAALFADLSGILRPPSEPAPPPLWWSYLSGRTATLREELAGREAAGAGPAFDYDWLCQCGETRKLQAIPRIIVERSDDRRSELRVGVALYGGTVRTIHLLFVKEQDGWKIDEIVNEAGYRFSQELARAIARTGNRPLRLTDPLRP